MNHRKKFKFAFVSNSAEVADEVKSCSNLETEEMIINLATMEEAVPVALNLLDDGVEVVLGGGGTGSLLMQAIGQPVIKIARTYLDLLNAFIAAKKDGSLIGLTSFSSPTYGLEVFEDLLSINIHQIVFSTTEELVNGITRAVAEGISCIVGGGICKKIVNSLGKPGIIVLPSKEVIFQALKDARMLALARRKEREETQQLHTILQTIEEGVIVIDNHANVKTLNKMALDILGIELLNTVGRPLPEFFKDAGMLSVLENGNPQIDQIRHVGKTDIVINSLPIEVDGKIRGVVATFKEASRIQSIDRKVREQLYFKGFVAKYRIDQIKGYNPKMKQLLQRSVKYARTDEMILIEGETGTGKEFLAHSLHNLSNCKDNAFVAVNCSALSESLLESELFGYEEGSFTGAKKGGKLGLFELASGGTIFLDEIADISPGLQVKLLRVLEEKEVMRVGGNRYVPVDVRVISSTNWDLGEQVRRGKFRRDLFFRLSVLNLRIPSLRDRREDIPILVHELLYKYGKGTKKISDESVAKIIRYDWPGNIRELDSLVKLYVILMEGSGPDDKLLFELLDEFKKNHNVMPENKKGFVYNESYKIAAKTLKERVGAYERAVIQNEFKKLNKKETAKRLGISVNTLWRKLNE